MLNLLKGLSLCRIFLNMNVSMMGDFLLEN